MSSLNFVIVTLILSFAFDSVLVQAQFPARSLTVKRDAEKHDSLHSHMSRKVFDRACAASKDVIDEIVACMTSNDNMTKAIKPEVAAGCYKDAFGADFDPKALNKHKEMICKNREKFETMTTCVYRKAAEAMSKEELNKLTDAMVDVGLCIVNALDS